MGDDGSSRLLLCQIAFENFAGSEVVTLELIEWFTARGWRVDLSTTAFGEPIASEVQALIADGRLHVLLPEAAAGIRAEHYDLIWVNHSYLPRSIVAGLAESPIATPMVWHHMSSFQSLGLPLLAEAEDALASVITSMAPVARDRVAEFGFDRHALELFDNPAPDSFVNSERRRHAARLESLLVVSNHPPAELLEATAALSAGGTHVTVAGLTGTYGRLKQEVIAEHDAVVTIGKSTQYALVMGVPVYSYDHFGGGGWITAENLEREHYGNFAGRIERRVLTAVELVDELQGGFVEARAFALEYRPVARSRWSLTRQLTAMLDDDRLQPVERSLTLAHVRRTELLCAQRDEFVSVVRAQRSHIASLEQEHAEETADARPRGWRAWLARHRS